MSRIPATTKAHQRPPRATKDEAMQRGWRAATYVCSRSVLDIWGDEGLTQFKARVLEIIADPEPEDQA